MSINDPEATFPKLSERSEKASPNRAMNKGESYFIELGHALLEARMELNRLFAQVPTAFSNQRRALVSYLSDAQAGNIEHGKNCLKREHFSNGYLHAEDDDSPYDVDSVAYCGRCHRVL